MRGLILMTTAITLIASPSWPAAITNLSGMPQSFIITDANPERVVTIAPGQTFRTLGKSSFRYQNRQLHIEDNEEYAIWRDGTFGPQRRMHRHRQF